MQTQRHLEPMTEKWSSFLKMVAMIAIPVALQNLLTTTGSMVDTIMLAQLDENVKGAVGLCSKYSNLLFSGYWGFVGGGMLFMSQYWGAGDHKGLCRSFGLMLSFMMAVAVLFGSFAAFAPLKVMQLLTDKQEYWSVGSEYLRFIGLAYIFQVFSIALSNMLRSMEKVRLPMIASIVSLVVNFCANEVLIFGHLGFPAMGAKGAALGTVISTFSNMAMILLMVAIKKYPLVFNLRDHFNWNKPFVGLFLKKSFPILVGEIMIGIGNFVLGLVLGRQSADMINALAVFNVFEGFVISFFSGFTIASSVLVGKEVGAGRHEIAYGRAKRLVILTPTVVFTACMIVLCFHKPLLTALGLSGESFVIGRGMLTIFTLVATVRMTNWLHNDTFRAAGNPVTGTVLEISFMYLLLIPLVVLAGLVWKWSPLLVFTCCYVDEPIRLVLMYRTLLSGRWIRPVTDEGKATLAEFREKHHVVMKGGKIQL